MRPIILIAMLFFSGLAHAGPSPSRFDAKGLVSHFHQLGLKPFMTVYDGQRIIVRGTIRHIDYTPAGMRGAWIEVDLKHAHDHGLFNQLTMWFARKDESWIRTASKEIEASCIVRPGIRLPALWSCEPSQAAIPGAATGN